MPGGEDWQIGVSGEERARGRRIQDMASEAGCLGGAITCNFIININILPDPIIVIKSSLTVGGWDQES